MLGRFPMRAALPEAVSRKCRMPHLCHSYMRHSMHRLANLAEDFSKRKTARVPVFTPELLALALSLWRRTIEGGNSGSNRTSAWCLWRFLTSHRNRTVSF